MFCRITGVCVHIAEPKKFPAEEKGKPDRVMKSFTFMVGDALGKKPPELVEVISFNGFEPKLNAKQDFDAMVRVRPRGTTSTGKSYEAKLVVEVL